MLIHCKVYKYWLHLDPRDGLLNTRSPLLTRLFFSHFFRKRIKFKPITDIKLSLKCYNVLHSLNGEESDLPYS